MQEQEKRKQEGVEEKEGMENSANIANKNKDATRIKRRRNAIQWEN